MDAKEAYVRITVGHYRGKVGVIDTSQSPTPLGNMIVLFATPPEHCKGVSLPRSFMVSVSRKYYFIDKLRGRSD